MICLFFCYQNIYSRFLYSKFRALAENVTEKSGIWGSGLTTWLRKVGVSDIAKILLEKRFVKYLGEKYSDTAKNQKTVGQLVSWSV